MTSEQQLALKWWNSLAKDEAEAICKKHGKDYWTIITKSRVEELWMKEVGPPPKVPVAKTWKPTMDTYVLKFQETQAFDFLQRIAQLPVGSTLSVSNKTTEMSSKTRKGNYLVLKGGLATDVYFVGQDLENDKLIVERLGC